MSKIFLETSVFIRYFTGDDEKKFADCVHLLKIIEEGKLRPYTSNIVIFEILFILTRVYKFPKKNVSKDVQKILSMRNLTLIEKTDTKQAIKIFNESNVKYPDCLIAAQIPKGVRLVSYDEDFRKLKVLIATPAELILT